MQFNSYVFILIFLPAVLLGYFGLNRIHPVAGKIFLIVASACFYVYGGWNVAYIFGISIVVNLLFALLIKKFGQAGKGVLILGIAANVGLLLYFKYTNFFLNTMELLFKKSYEVKDIVLPLAISFFTFQQISYLVNVYQGKLKDTNWLDYLVYIFYFPKLISGPIAEPAPFIEQFKDPERKKVSFDNIAAGARVFCYGLFKKMLFANTFAKAVSWGFANVSVMSSMDLILLMLSYTFEIYFDFSGYCDMAVGISQMLNIDLPINFDSPYKALSIRDFWRRWHISLTSFLTKYIYIPLGGSRKGKVRTYIHIMIVFLISGIWHGANYTFILWGILHGLLCVFDRLTEKMRNKLMEAVKWFATFSAVNVLWLLFASEKVSQWVNLLKRILSFQSLEISDGMIQSFLLPESGWITNGLHLSHIDANVNGLWLLIFMASAFLICLIPENNYKTRKTVSYIGAILSAIAFIWSFICLGGESTFLYFGF